MDRDLMIAAYVDGELPTEDQRRFEAQMAADPELARQVERQGALRARLAAAFDPVLTEPVPERLTEAARAAPAKAARPALDWRLVGSLAACLVVGLLIGRMAAPGGPLRMEGGVMVARADLARTLDDGLAADAGPIRVGLSFRTAEGGYCRTFQSGPDRLAGLACRQDDRWVAKTVATLQPGEAGTYRTAGSETPPEVLAAVDRLIAGDPLDAAAEKAARARGWR
jgi:hypothetical protein